MLTSESDTITFRTKMGAYYNRRLPNSSKTANGSLAESRQNIQTNSNLRHKRGSARDDFRYGNQNRVTHLSAPGRRAPKDRHQHALTHT